MRDPSIPLNISSKEITKYMQETGSGEESDESVG
jgi:hypothetical protein